ncbi:MAG: Rieske 2Fe-2S domain-containing protein [Dehalococcoidia bacterium]|nr:Rieske 2Fe-2S domain-containing protein [Dehalococcoidia bacterium]
MLSHDENGLLTRTGPDTPMGETLRRYWMPALLASEISEADCPPVRVKLLGEDLLAFRDTQGRVGLVDEFCAHRRTSLWLGRNEECGIRCVYHGWKYDVDGRCVDMMNEPAESRLREEVRITAYPTVDLGGIIWAYMGPPDLRPPEPAFEWTQVSEEQRGVSKNWQECNWLQALEGGVDTAHVPILHRNFTANTTKGGYAPNSTFAKAGPPTVEVDTTDYGYRYAGIRSFGDDEIFVRTYHFVMPFHQFRPGENTVTPYTTGHIWVPIDDDNCMVYNWAYSTNGDPFDEWDMVETRLGRGPGQLQPDFRSIRNMDNQYLIDRVMQKNENFTGIEGVNNQDQAVQEMMGAVVDRTREYLTSSDLTIVQLRRLLLEAVRTVSDGGDPPGARSAYYKLRALDRIMPKGASWRDEMLPDMYPDSVSR